MAQVIPFEDRAVASLRARLGAAEEANEDLIALARGHFGAVSSIHRAALLAISAESLEALIDVVTRAWPAILRTDTVVLAISVGDRAFRADRTGVHRIDGRILDKLTVPLPRAELRAVDTGHPLFGADSRLVWAEALVRFGDGKPYPVGLLLLGQHQAFDLDSGGGSKLLVFLADVVAAMLRRWLMDPNNS